MTAKSASNCPMLRGWPLQNAQPTGANWKPKARISPMNGWDMAASQFRLGKTPDVQITNVMQSDGMMLGCDWLEPVIPQAPGAMGCGISGFPIPGGLT